MNATALRRLIRNNENAKGFDLGNWFHPCGTYGCLVGNDRIAAGQIGELVASVCIEMPDQRYGPIGLLYGINRRDAEWLFSTWVTTVGPNARKYKRAPKDLAAALNRVRKYIEYRRRKDAIWNVDGPLYEVARKVGGNWGVMSKVLETLALGA